MLHLSVALTAYILFLTAIFGLAMGSFLNCFAWRLVHGESLTKGRSHCVSCDHSLGAKDLIPIVSYVALKGRCRYCGTTISLRYPIIELISMLVFLSLVLKYDVSFLALRFLVFAAILLLISLVDWEKQQIPDRFQLALIVWYLITLPLVSTDMLPALLDGLKGGFLLAVLLLLFVLLVDKLMGREAMGGGDIKLFFCVGLYLGLPLNLLNLIISCIVGVIFGLIYQRHSTNKEDQRAIPFGPAIAVGTWLTLLFGNRVLHWYISLFF
jgi:leader peptidase (prepilin peptidase)/N-methyltransferase